MLTDQEKLTYMHISDVGIVEMIMKRVSNIFLLFPHVSQANSLLTQSSRSPFSTLIHVIQGHKFKEPESNLNASQYRGLLMDHVL